MGGRAFRRLAILGLGLALLGARGYPDALPERIAAGGLLLDGPEVSVLSPSDVAQLPALPVPVGERIVYRVSYFAVPVGDASIEVARLVEVDGRRYAHLVATARTNEFFDRFYRVDDRTEAWVGLDDGRVVRTRTRTQHGSKEMREEVRFDWDTHFVHVRRVKTHTGNVRELAFDFGPFVHDIFDAFYALRATALEPGAEVQIPVYASRKVHGFLVRTGRERELHSAVLGPVRALELLPVDTVDGKPKDAGNGRVWVTTGELRLPFRVEGWFRFTKRIRIGGVRAELIGFEAADSSWPRWQPPASWVTPPRVADSVDGRPVWDPPAEVRAARERAGVEAYERKFPLEAAG